MPIVASELVAYGAANHAEDDVTTQGGAIDETVQVEFTEMAANDTLEVVSDNAADSMNITVHARDAAGAIVSEQVALNGTTPVALSTLGTVERFMKAVLASAAAGNVTVQRATGPTDVAVLAPGVTEIRRLFWDAASEASQTTRYEKFFFKNENGSLTLTNATIELTADPDSTIRIGGAPSKDDTATIANRETAPGSVTFVDDGVTQAVPGDSLEAGAAIGIWAEMVRGADAAALKSTFTVQLAGTTV